MRASSVAFVLAFAFVLLSLARPTEGVQVRVINALPNAPNLSVYFNRRLAFRNLDFKAVTQYLEFAPSRYTVSIVQDNNSKLLYEVSGIQLSQARRITLVLHGTLNEGDKYAPAIAKLTDDVNPADDEEPYYRFYHAAAGVRTVNVTLNDSEIFGDIAYANSTDYRGLAEGSFFLTVSDAHSGRVVVGGVPISIRNGTVVNTYLVGSPSSSSDRLTVLIVIDNEVVGRAPGFNVDSVNAGSIVVGSVMLLAA